jgi:HTH-type transcriptional regulator/antitoxin HigA
MEEMQLKQKDLIPFIGNKSKVSEVLNRKVGLSLNMIYNLAKGLHLPLEVLVQPSKEY